MDAVHGQSLPTMVDWLAEHPLLSGRNRSVHKVKESVVAQLCPTLCDPADCSPPGSSVNGILQARILEWVAISEVSMRAESESRLPCERAGRPW